MIRKPSAQFVQRPGGRPVWYAVCPSHGRPIEGESSDCCSDEDPEDEDV